MAAAKRKSNPSVKQRLFDQGCCFNFFKAVHLLERFAGGKSQGHGLSPLNDPVRFRVQPGFGFPASDIMSIRNGHMDLKAEATVNFMGLIGPQGLLPQWYNEHAQQLINKKDYAFTDFLDMFHHRLISLFYMAWKKYRLAENFLPDSSDAISSSLADLVGSGLLEHNSDTAFRQCILKRLIYFSGMVSRIVPTASALEAIISNAVGAAVQVEQFVARMMTVHADDRTSLGLSNSTLQKDAMCGSRVRDTSTYFIVKIGPLCWDKYLAFQPHSRNLDLVYYLIARIAGMEYEFEVRLILKGPEIPGLCLGGRKGAPLLGRTVLLRSQQRPYGQDIVIRTAVIETHANITQKWFQNDKSES